VEVFEKLQLWIDPVLRTGPEAMAVDEWLLETITSPVLRIYKWSENWASIGYFGKIAEARATFSDVHWVRRWTGGGIVDHRADWTYTIIAPSSEPLANWRGAESYRRIHTALATALITEGITARLSSGAEETGATLCFENPVSHDLLDLHCRKLAGAGQRRSRQGLLHQGSVAGREISPQRAENLASQLAAKWELFSFQPDPQDIAQRAAARYSRPEWTARR
jgi:lipoyl(octanoyl) transferase